MLELKFRTVIIWDSAAKSATIDATDASGTNRGLPMVGTESRRRNLAFGKTHSGKRLFCIVFF